jgi:DNA-binding response OmpR family regulator
LAIDDDAVLLKMTEDMLTRNRVRCDTCQDVQELTKRMREQKYNLLITDIRMPKISGFDLLELLRSSDIGMSRTIPVLALTARADYNEADFTALGFAGCLYKPFSIVELLLAVQGCIGEPMKESPLQADFNELLSGEQNNKEMLKLLIRETEKDIKTLKESMEKEDRHSMLELLHHLLPLWEIVRVNSPLDNLCQILAGNTDMKGNEVNLGVNKVIETGKQLILQASKQVKEESYV